MTLHRKRKRSLDDDWTTNYGEYTCSELILLVVEAQERHGLVVETPNVVFAGSEKNCRLVVVATGGATEFPGKRHLNMLQNTTRT